MATHTLKTTQKIPADIHTIWNFFSDPSNLQTITPDFLKFKIHSSNLLNKTYQGQIIEYTVRPILNIPFYWMTEITHVKDGEFFVDEQRFGPYQLWHHQHHFKLIDGGVEMTDIVHYRLPFWWLGDIVNSLMVRKQLKQIFDFRYKKIEAMFGRYPNA
ncbi:MAG: SRPBCC family protein [Lacibacter sp.]